MITAKDVEFHSPTTDHYAWAETNYFGFYVKERNFYVSAYALPRVNVGAVLSGVTINHGYANPVHEALYSDWYIHLPVPDSLAEYELPNGLGVRAKNAPMDYRVWFDGGKGVRFDVEFTGLMPPFDIHDPDMDPLASQRKAGDRISDSSYAGHWDQTGRYRGWLEVYGERFEVDCVSIMDHSWGVREEPAFNCFCWNNVNFDDDTSFHIIWQVNPERLDRFATVLHGYVREGDRVYGLVEGHAEVQRDGYLHRHFDVWVKDERGQTHCFIGTPMTSNPFVPWPALYMTHSFVRWYKHRDGGVVGWGETQDFCKAHFGAQSPP